MIKYLAIAFAAWNIITFLMMGLDKRKAVKDKRRISEATLLGSAFIMGGIGILAGAIVFHHKTRKIKFQVGMPLAVIVNVLIIYGLYYINVI